MKAFLFTLFCNLLFTAPGFAAPSVVVGSKIFTESYVLGEIAARVIEDSSHQTVIRKLGMGSTGILFESLKNGAIDLYPDYSGTIAEAILKDPKLKSLDEIRKGLAPYGLTISDSMGFNNTYALAVKESFAEKYNLTQMSDLTKVQTEIRAAFSYEFMDREDGYRGMVKRYGFQFESKSVNRMEHSLVYRAIGDGAVDVIEVYSTDANIKKFKLRVLRDDREYFPAYQGVWVARLDFVRSHASDWKALLEKTNAISEAKMRELNAKADIDQLGFPAIASQFLHEAVSDQNTLSDQLWLRTKEHLSLVFIALLFSILIGIPLGIMAAKYRLAGQAILLVSAVVQTIPALALLCFLIPVFGIGAKPALAALCLYSLLPVVLNTFTGIRSIDQKHLENARAFGLNPKQILFKLSLPLASPTILAGVKTATIVSIGTATLAALVGAGGYGVLIVSGLSLNNMHTILSGAIPAALMAFVAYALFEGLGRILIPAPLRGQKS